MKFEFKHRPLPAAFVSLAMGLGLVVRDAAAENIVCGLGRIKTLELGNRADYISDVYNYGPLWLKIEPEFVNESAGAAQYPETDTIRLLRNTDPDLFQRQMLILTTAFIQGTPIRIISDKTAPPKCSGTADDFQILTCDDATCETLPL